MIREAEPSGPTSTWWLGKTGEYTTDVLRREAMLVVCPERERRRGVIYHARKPV